MTKEEILAKLKQHKSYMQQEFGVEKIGLFGSYARDEAQEESDVDIYVYLQKNDFMKIASLWNFLENLYHKKVDLYRENRFSKGAIHEVIKQETIFI